MEQKQPRVVLCKKRCSQENICARDSSLKTLQAEPATLLKKRFQHRCFPVNFAKFLRTHFLQNTSGWLLLTDPTFTLSLNLVYKSYKNELKCRNFEKIRKTFIPDIWLKYHYNVMLIPVVTITKQTINKKYSIKEIIDK